MLRRCCVPHISVLYGFHYFLVGLHITEGIYDCNTVLLIRYVSRNKDFQRRSNSSSVFFVGRLLSQISQGALAQKVCGALTNCDIDLAVQTKVIVTLRDCTWSLLVLHTPPARNWSSQSKCTTILGTNIFCGIGIV